MPAAQAAKEETPVFLLAAGVCPALTENSHRGHRLPTAVLYPGIGPANSNTASGLRVCLFDSGRRSRSTGKERDAESGLDFFEARYYSGAQGRFTSPDEFKGGFLDAFTEKAAFSAGPLPYADIADPQTLNKYSYVRNNPLRYVDPDGHDFLDYLVGGAKGVWNSFLDNVVNVGAPQVRVTYGTGQQPGTDLHASASNNDQQKAMGVVEAVAPVAATVATSAAQGASPTTQGGPGFVVSTGGDAIIVPSGASGPNPVVNPQGNTTGFSYNGGQGGPGLDPRVTDVRIMDPTAAKGSSPGYPNGYVTYQNGSGQGVNPQTGRTVPNSDPSRHMSLSPPKTCTTGGSCP